MESNKKVTNKLYKRPSSSNQSHKMLIQLSSTKFESDYFLIKKMRKELKAPVDTMGVKSCPDSTADYEVYKYQSLISLLLSSQTKDTLTYSTVQKLIKHGLTIDSILKLTEKELVVLIYPVSFHNNKAKNILKMTEKIQNDYDNKPPEEFKEIIKLPGIGKKMAYIYLTDVLKKYEGIGVDTHIHKIANRLKWVNNTKTPEKTRIELEEVVNKKYWKEMNEVIVGFGQKKCKTVKPLCEDCLLKSRCSYYENVIKAKSESKSKSKSKSKSRNKSIKKLDIEKRRNSPKKKFKIRYSR